MNSIITNKAPIAGSDNEGQLCQIHYSLNGSRHTTWKTHTDYTLLNQLLLQVNWNVLFSGCNNTDECAERFYDFLLDAISKSSTRKKISRRQRLPKHIVKLLRLKKKAWREAKKTNNYDKVLTSRRTVRAAILQHRRNMEQRLIFANNRQAFFRHVYQIIGMKTTACKILL